MKINKIFVLFVLLMTIVPLSGCKDNAESQVIRIADKDFMMPSQSEFPGWIFYKNYERLQLHLDVDRFEATKKAKSLDHMKKQVRVKIDPISKINTKYYWTKKEPYLNQQPVFCEINQGKLKKYELCAYGKQGKHDSAHGLYTIQNVLDKTDVTVLHCTESLENLPNPLCIGRFKFMGNLHVTYTFNIHYLPKVLEIDNAIKEIINDLILK